MDATALRALQAPLKQRYREDPGSARAPMHAEGTFAEPGITCTVPTWSGPVRAGLHPFTGGDGSDACSGDMLLQALVACAGVTMRSVATAMGIDVRGARLTASADMDARGTLGVDREARVGFGAVEVVAEVDTDADDAALTRLGQLTERYCVVAQSLAGPVHLTVRRS
ncbi:OsmC family protein [Blastococcus sp. VKM Ac-2987]|uniref:OsmC family protein n=1 Tax=Blastococcus sp. VKM Ac-2987 TaxID=3004141 RepID=UPI0022ABA22E|nr:OsmC family protein [Blastococcus sp. VKM Ac-2987]MCZ2857867.1 OsmC family protein [Blastococcus sp. VKM Ac-2987]